MAGFYDLIDVTYFRNDKSSPRRVVFEEIKDNYEDYIILIKDSLLCKTNKCFLCFCWKYWQKSHV